MLVWLSTIWSIRISAKDYGSHNSGHPNLSFSFYKYHQTFDLLYDGCLKLVTGKSNLPRYQRQFQSHLKNSYSHTTIADLIAKITLITIHIKVYLQF